MKKIFSLLFLIPLLGAIGVQAQTPIIHQDFSDGTWGSGNLSLGSNAAGNRRGLVVGESTDPVDPFGGAGNRSLLLEQSNATANGVVGVRWNFPTATPSLSAGVVEFEAYAYHDTTWSSPSGAVYVRSGSNHGVFMIFSATGGGRVSIQSRNDAGSNIQHTFDDVWSLNDAQRVKIEFFQSELPSEELVFKVWINEQLLTHGTGENARDWFYMRTAGLTALNSVELAHSSTTGKNSRFFINELTVSTIPEPGTYAGIMVFLLAGFFLHKRAFARRL